MSATPAKAKKAAKPKKPATHPKYSEMIAKAIGSLKERGGSSRQAILKYIVANFNVGKDANAVNSRLKLALRRAVAKGQLKQAKGTGASGSFRLEKQAAPKKKAVKPKAKKPKAKKPAGEGAAAKPKKTKSPKKVKPAKAKKPKTPKKAKAAKPKKAKSPKKAAKPKAKKSPKKAAKKVAKK